MNTYRSYIEKVKALRMDLIHQGLNDEPISPIDKAATLLDAVYDGQDMTIDQTIALAHAYAAPAQAEAAKRTPSKPRPSGVA